MTQKLRDELSAIEEKLKTLNNRRDEIEQCLYELEDLPRLKALVGKFFKFDNTMPHHIAPRWVYLRVRSANPKGSPGSSRHTIYVDRLDVWEEEGGAVAELQRNTPYFEGMLEHPSSMHEWQEALRRVRIVFESLDKEAKGEEKQ